MIEYEEQYILFNQGNILKKLKNNLSLHHPFKKFRVIVFETHNPNHYLRIRDEYDGIFITSKIHDNEYPKEHNLQIQTVEEGLRILETMGFYPRHKYEKLRESWDVKVNNEKIGKIEFDWYPGVELIMEVEASSFNNLQILKNLLKPDIGKRINMKSFVNNYLRSNYGFNRNFYGDYNFNNLEIKTLEDKENIRNFEKLFNILMKQKKYYK